jgi:hypothetical protein
MSGSTYQPKSYRMLARLFGWNRSSTVLFSVFVLLLVVIVYFWWPLVVDYWSTYNPDYPIWVQLDWLLLGNFVVMSLLIMAHANLGYDLPILLVGFAGGLIIEAWGTQTSLWTYYTLERPPLWIVPAWPIASLAIDRIYRLFYLLTDRSPGRFFRLAYWPVLLGFFGLMLDFVLPTLGKPLTILALLLSALIILTPPDKRAMLLTFLAGSGLGYFLERWGTTRLCWTYYTLETPPLFAVLAHGMAALVFWRVVTLVRSLVPRISSVIRWDVRSEISE